MAVWVDRFKIKKFLGVIFSSETYVNIINSARIPFVSTRCVCGTTSINTQDDVYLFSNQITKHNDNEFTVSPRNYTVTTQSINTHDLKSSPLTIYNSDRIVFNLIVTGEVRASSKKSWMRVSYDIFIDDAFFATIGYKQLMGVDVGWGIEPIYNSNIPLISTDHVRPLGDGKGSGYILCCANIQNNYYKNVTISARNYSLSGDSFSLERLDFRIDAVVYTEKTTQVRYGSNNVAIFYEEV